jgi:hypothetical protein
MPQLRWHSSPCGRLPSRIQAWRPGTVKDATAALLILNRSRVFISAEQKTRELPIANQVGFEAHFGVADQGTRV